MTVVASGRRVLDDDQLRKALSLLRRPDRLVTPEILQLLDEHGIKPANESPLAVGREAAGLLRAAIERLQPTSAANRDQQLPFRILNARFVDGDTVRQAAHKLGLSERQFSREQAWAIGLLKAELTTPIPSEVAAPAPATTPVSATVRTPYRPEPIPTIGGYLRRTEVATALTDRLSAQRMVVVSGPPGIGKTTLVADLAANRAADHPVLWYRVRAGVNDSLTALLYELGDYTGDRGVDIIRALGQHDSVLAARGALKTLDGGNHLIVIDDFHHIETDVALCGFLDEAIARLPQLQLLLISRHQESTPLLSTTSFHVPALSWSETEQLLEHLGVRPSTAIIDALHGWTNGVPQLVNLAAAWLKSSDEPSRRAGLAELSTHANVQDFLLSTITDLLDPDDRAILTAASIFRDRFSDDALAAVAQRSRGAVLDGIRRLIRSHVATRSRNGENAFFHATVREYVYDRLGVDERSVMHLRAAAWYAGHGYRDEAEHHRIAAGSP